MLTTTGFESSFSAEKRLHHCAVEGDTVSGITLSLVAAFLCVSSLLGDSVSQPGVPMPPPSVIRMMPSKNQWSRLFLGTVKGGASDGRGEAARGFKV